MNRRRPARNDGVTLLETVMVIAIIGLLVGLLVPGLQAARETARRTVCQSNLRQLGLSVQQFVALHQFFPPAATWREETGTISSHILARHSLFAYLLPFFDQNLRIDQLDLKLDWNDPHNTSATRQHLGGILICPSAPGERDDDHPSDYCPAIRVDSSESTGVGLLIRNGQIANRSQGPGPEWGNHHRVWSNCLQIARSERQHPFTGRGRLAPHHVTDGSSNTVLLVEDAGKPICFRAGQRVDCQITRFRWASPSLWMTINDYCRQSQLINCSNNSQPYAFHRGGINIVAADGSVRFIDEAVTANVFVSLITMAGQD